MHDHLRSVTSFGRTETYLQVANFMDSALRGLLIVIQLYFHLVQFLVLRTGELLHVARAIEELLELLLDGTDDGYLRV